eukprot:COSAG02_NODE_700_length_18341_cov_52.629043_9_plen_676_part_00
MCLCALAIAMAGMVTRKARSAIGYVVLWYSYLSMQALIGHDPPLLFEAGFLAIILGPGRPPAAATDPVVAALSSSAARVGLASARWVLFRLLFGAGVVKLLGGDPSWWGLTATSHHYQSQPLPTPLAWWMKKLPMPIHKLSTVIMFVVECGVSMLCFAPGQGTLRRAAFAAQLGLQVIMGVTGSFSFFQPLTAILAIPLLASARCNDTAAGAATATQTAAASPPSIWATVFRGSLALAGSTTSTVSAHWASVEKSVGIAIVAGGMLAFRVPLFRPAFTLAHLEVYIRVMTGAAVVLAGREMITECASCLAAVASAFSHRRRLGSGVALTTGTLGLMLHAVVSSFGGMVFFLASLHPFTRGVSTTFVRSFLGPRPIPQLQVSAQPTAGRFRGGSNHAQAVLREVLASSTGDRYYSSEFLGVAADAWNWPQWLVSWGNEALRWQLARPYGMFIRMTGTEGIRPELEIEAAHHTTGPWIELPFRYKPSEGRALPWVSPHNPRMDYAMWTAANGGEDTPGIIPRFCAKLLDGSPAVAGLLRPKDYAKSFPPGSPPNFVRVVQYDYKFSSIRERWLRGAGPWTRQRTIVGQSLDRTDLGALAPGVARAYEAALVKAADQPWERVMLWLRAVLVGDGRGAEFMWVCLALPVFVRIGLLARARVAAANLAAAFGDSSTASPT